MVLKKLNHIILFNFFNTKLTIYFKFKKKLTYSGTFFNQILTTVPNNICY